MIRFISIIIFLLFFAVFCIIALPVCAIIGKFNKTVRDRIAFVIVTNTFRIILFLAGTKLVVNGMENVPKDKTVLYVGNHRSYFDIIALYTLVPGLTGFVAKIEIKKIPVLNLWMRYMNCLFLDRDDIRQGLKVILEGIELMKSGISMCIFPEGTRNKNENECELLPFKEGSFKLAEKSGSPVVPVAIHKADDCFENSIPRVKKNTVTIEFGKPIYINELDKEDRKFIGAKVRENIISMLKSYK